ncbi:MAG: hypothetical protein AB7P20_24810 [Rhizobiaceae bacterium]
MDWKAANERQDEARWRVILMFVVMALMDIRTGLVSRGVLAVLPIEDVPQDPAPAVDDQPSSASPADLNHAILALLCLAEAAGRLVILNERAVWELMDQPLSGLTQERSLDVASLRERPTQRLDTS